MLLAMVLSVSVQGQSPPEPPTPTTIQSAEAEGTRFSSEAPPTELTQHFTEGATQGASGRRCVEIPVTRIPDTVVRRSGEIVVGGGIGDLAPGKDQKVWWVPLHDPSARSAKLVVRGARLDQPSITAVFESAQYGWPFSTRQVDRNHAFYPTAFVLPSAGRWVLTVTSAKDWGCFVVTVHP
jgi:hypothetical protein